MSTRIEAGPPLAGNPAQGPRFWHKLRVELRAMLLLAIPVIAAQITQMLLMISDTVMVGRVGSLELASVALGTNIIFFLAVGPWMALGIINPVIAHHLGAGQVGEIRRTLPQALWLGVLCAVPVTLALLAAAFFLLPALELDQRQVEMSREYILTYSVCILPLMVYFSSRYFLEGLGHTGENFVVSLMAVPLNLLGNYALIFGNFGAPQLGTWGAAITTATVNTMMGVALLLITLRRRHLQEYTSVSILVRPDWKKLWEMARVGIPMGAAVFAEVSAFTGLGIAMSKFGADAMAANQIVMNVVSTSFMVPLGLAAAIASRSGRFLGAGDPRSARFSAWTGIGLGVGFMICSALGLYLVGGDIIRLYTKEPAVVAIAGTMLFYGMLFQVFDGVQATVMGALRGMKDTTVPMIICTLCYWGCGFVPGMVLAFVLGWGPLGIWTALPPCLALASAALLWRYITHSRRMLHAPPPGPGDPDPDLDPGTGHAPHATEEGIPALGVPTAEEMYAEATRRGK